MRKRLFTTIVLIFVAVFAAQAFSPNLYKLKQKINLGGDGGWDYLTFDAAGKRLFISRGTRVMVVDPYKGSVITEIPNTPGVHGIALAQDLGKGFISNGRENSVTVFDLKTLKETNRIKIDGQNPDAILYDPPSKRVLTFNGRSSNATVIDATNDKVTGTVPLDGKPEFAVSDGKGIVFVNIEDKSEITSIDPKSAAVQKSWPLKPCESPSGLAMDQKRRRLFAGCENKMLAVMNADSGQVVTTLPIGEGVDATGFDPATNLIFSSNGEGNLTVIHEDSPDKFTVADNPATQRSARTMAVDTTNHNVYLVAAEFEPAPATQPGQQRQRPPMKPGTFTLLVMGRQ